MSHMSSFIISAFILAFMTMILIPREVVGCGCYGPNSCTPSGNCPYNQGFPSSPCFCDCCPVCNTCDQLFQGCAEKAYYQVYNLTLDPPITPPFLVAKVGQPIQTRTVISQSTNKWRAILNGYEFCIRPELPKGLKFGLNDTTSSPSQYSVYQLSGTPEIISSPNTYKVIFKGSAELLSTFEFTLAAVY
ncbi:hypothetical protein G9A89_002349 [Geosiphon pyriformis]|nr:hypothetical protein G9A89_002349 [Geosiphon pyriformis]